MEDHVERNFAVKSVRNHWEAYMCAFFKAYVQEVVVQVRDVFLK